MERLAHFSTRSGVLDLLLSAAVLAITVFGALTLPLDSGMGAIGWLVLPIPTLALAFRRVAPTAALGVAVIGTVANWTLGTPETTLAATISIYTVASLGRAGHRAWISIASVTLLTGYTALGAFVDAVSPVYIGVVALSGALAHIAGSHQATRSELLETAQREAAAARARADAIEEAAIQAERARIARDLHDVVAHGLGAVVIQAQAAQRVIGDDPEAAAEAMAHVERSARGSLDEMRVALGVLRRDPALTTAASGPESVPMRPAPGVASLDELVDDFRANGVQVHLETGDTGALSPSIDAAAYRIVQESLTNVMKHAGPARAWVSLDRDDRFLDISVRDDGARVDGEPNPRHSPRHAGDADAHRGDGAHSDGAHSGGAGEGYGLRGMRERVEHFGGSFACGPSRHGGYQVRARLPVEAET